MGGGGGGGRRGGGGQDNGFCLSSFSSVFCFFFSLSLFFPPFFSSSIFFPFFVFLDLKHTLVCLSFFCFWILNIHWYAFSLQYSITKINKIYCVLFGWLGFFFPCKKPTHLHWEFYRLACHAAAVTRQQNCCQR